MTEPKTRERLKVKGSNFGAYLCLKKFGFMTATCFKTKVFQMLMTTTFLQKDALI